MSSISAFENNSIILDFIDKRILSENFNEEIPKTIRIVKPILIALGITISALGKVPFIPISLRLKKFGVFRYFLAASNTIGFWILGSWSSKNIINEVFQHLTPEEKILLKNQLSCLSKTTSIITGFFFSVSSQAVIAYLAYTCNNKNILMPIAKDSFLVQGNS